MIRFALTDLPAPLGQILHVGAGSGSDLPQWRAAGASAITLVEPAPEALEALREAVADSAAAPAATPPVTVIAAAVSAAGAAAVLHRFNFPDLSSLSPATAALQTLFPGLRALEPEPVVLRDPAELVERLGLAGGRCHVLVLEAPGQAQAILAALQTADLLTRFSRLVVQEAETVLYEGQSPASTISAWLEGLGYAVRRDETADPDRPHLCATRDTRAVELGNLRTRLAETEAARDAVVTERDAARARITALEAAAAQQAKAQQADKTRADTAEDQLRMALLREEQLTARYHEELLKAQGQIEFIRDLLLGGSTL